jgi:hypothetical protein
MVKNMMLIELLKNRRIESCVYTNLNMGNNHFYEVDQPLFKVRNPVSIGELCNECLQGLVLKFKVHMLSLR